MNEHIEEIWSVASGLYALANSFEHTGNQTVAFKLRSFAARLDTAREGIQNDRIARSKEDLESAKHIAGGLLSAALAGCIGYPQEEPNA